jgi:hypothetical protein
MKILRRCRRITNLQIVFCAQLKEALQPGARMLWPLAFVTMRQQHREPRRLHPLVFRGGDVLIDDRLSAVNEVAKLRFPHHQSFTRDHRVAVFKTEDTFFRKGTIKNFKTCFRF